MKRTNYVVGYWDQTARACFLGNYTFGNIEMGCTTGGYVQKKKYIKITNLLHGIGS